jgi:flagellar M-ring protein FliF
VNPQDLLARLRELRESLTTRQLITLAIAFVGVVTLVAGSAWWLNKPEYRLLFADMEPEEAARVESVLTTQKVDYRLLDGGRAVEVPKDQVDRLRLHFTSDGLPTSGRIGFEIFDKVAFGQTEFLEQVNYRRALEGEIARTIATINEVANARVHIAMAKDSLFESRSQPAKASVILKLKKNRPPAASTIAGIVNLVAASVEGLRPEAIVLIDSFGRPLARPSDESDEPLSGSAFERQQRLEKEFSNRVVGMLEPIVGSERVRVNVSLRLNSNTEEQTEERYDPASVIRSRQISLEGANSPAAQGLAGARGNLPGTTPPAPAGAPVTPAQPPAPTLSASSSNRSSETTNFEIGKVVRHTVKPRGDIARLSVAVVVDDDHQVKLDQAGKTVRSTKPRTPAEMQKIQQIVATAVGLDATRGDQITVENVAFDDNSEPMPEPTLMERYGDPVIQNLAPLVVLILGLGALLFVVRPIMRAVLPPREKKAAVTVDTAPLPAATLPVKSIEEIEGEIEAQLDAKAAPQLQDRKTPVLQRRVAKIVTDEPENAARLVRSWLLEDKA